MDAGLPNAYQLTRKVYDRLVQIKSKDATLFAVVVSKLIGRNAKSGKSPFDEINIEDVYDGLKRLINRDGDLLSEFVSGWDPISTTPSQPFDGQRFANNLASIFEIPNGRSLGREPIIRVNQRKIESVVSELQRALEGDFYNYRGASLDPFLSTLCDLLQIDETRISYMQQFLSNHSAAIECISTLNYDRLVEISLLRNGTKADIGLTQWNQKRYVRFHGQGLKLIKLHGSVDWFIQNDDEVVVESDKVYSKNRAMIF